jgi:hypothetical protein
MTLPSSPQVHCSREHTTHHSRRSGYKDHLARGTTALSRGVASKASYEVMQYGACEVGDDMTTTGPTHGALVAIALAPVAVACTEPSDQVDQAGHTAIGPLGGDDNAGGLQ